MARGGEEGRVHQRLRDPVPGGGAGSRCREPVLAAPPARAVVLVGSVARFAFSEHLHRDVSDHLLGPVDVGGRGRLLVSLRHPNSRGGVKSFQGQLTDSQLAQVREALSAPTSGWPPTPARGSPQAGVEARSRRLDSVEPRDGLSCGGWGPSPQAALA